MRARIFEHLKKAQNFSSNSFIVQHWCQAHGTETARPDFKFKVEHVYREALSRQLSEAIMIEESGTLNSKAEFGMNHICRLVTEKHPWDAEQDSKIHELRTKKDKQDLHEFIAVMKNVLNTPSTDADTNQTNVYRFFKKVPEKRTFVGTCEETRERKRIKKNMDSSTPINSKDQRRDPGVLWSPTEISPAPQEEQTSDCPSFHSDPGQRSPTGASREMDTAQLTPSRRVETSAEIEGGANDLFNAAMRTGALNKSCPVRQLSEDLEERETLSLGAMV